MPCSASIASNAANVSVAAANCSPTMIANNRSGDSSRTRRAAINPSAVIRACVA